MSALTNTAQAFRNRIESLPESEQAECERIMNVSVPLIQVILNGYVRSLSPEGRAGLNDLDFYLAEHGV